jgi:hypothetical protein
MPSVKSRHRSIDKRPEWTASISTHSTRTAGGSGSTTRVTTKCFSLSAGETAVHLLSKSFFGLSGFFLGSTSCVERAVGSSGAVMGVMIPLAAGAFVPLRPLARGSERVALLPQVVAQDELRNRRIVEYAVVPDLHGDFYAISATLVKHISSRRC